MYPEPLGPPRPVTGDLYFTLLYFYKYYISNKGLVEECDKEDVEVTGDCCCFLFEKTIVKRSVQCHVFTQSQPGWRPSDKNQVKTSHRSQFLCKNPSFALLFDSNSTAQSDTLVGRKKWK